MRFSMMASHSLNRALKDDEFVELDELLAQLDEDSLAMDASQADGFLTALCLLSQEVPPTEWMPLIFCAPTAKPSVLKEPLQTRLEELLYRRYREINHRLAQRQPIDPIVFDPEDDNGEPLTGEDEIVALQPFASGFLTAAQKWSGLLDSDNPEVTSALVGVWRHLPEEEIGDFASVRDELLSESPLENLDDAIEDIAICIKQIASVTRGFSDDKKQGQGINRSSRRRH